MESAENYVKVKRKSGGEVIMIKATLDILRVLTDISKEVLILDPNYDILQRHREESGCVLLLKSRQPTRSSLAVDRARFVLA